MSLAESDAGPSIPASFAHGVRGESGTAGAAWLDRLPSTIAHVLRTWQLTLDGDPMHGYLALVAPVRGDHPGRCVIKFAQPGDLLSQESLALTAWRGHGAVELHRFDLDLGVLQLERLDSEQTLNSVAIGDAVDRAASLLRTLAISPPEGIPTLADKTGPWPDTWPHDFAAANQPFPRAWLVHALGMCEQLTAEHDQLLVNEDLHFGNVLRGVREPWSVIDPKVVVGDLEYGVAPMFWSRHGEDALDARLATIVNAARLDAEKARGWLLVRAIEFWLWAIPLGFTQAAQVCSNVAAWLMESSN